MFTKTFRLSRLVLSIYLLSLLVSCGYFPYISSYKDQAAKAGTSVANEIVPSIELCKGEAREVLKKFCGKCHLKSISKKPKALKIYTLEDDIWYKNLSKSNLKGITRRISKWDGTTEEEVNTVLGCVACLESETCR